VTSTPAQLRQRAHELRQCAHDARAVAKRLGPYLDSVVKQATSPIWTGPYATHSTTTLTGHKKTLHQMAADLLTDAGRWETEADALEKKASKGDKGGAGKGH
jgi:hypothetical protein